MNTPEIIADGADPERAGARSGTPSAPDPGASVQRCGLIAIVGKPNVGKSTLLNALVGQKISITSRKAQTTRHRITGVRTLTDGQGGGTQYVFVDTPGFQTRHSTALNKSLNKTVLGAIDGVDLVLFVVEAGSFTLQDAKVLSLLKPGTPALLVANKLDSVHRRAEIAPWLKGMQERHPFAEFVPMSAKNPRDVARLLEICARYLPEQPCELMQGKLADMYVRLQSARAFSYRVAGSLDRGAGRAARKDAAACCASPPPSWSSAKATRRWSSASRASASSASAPKRATSSKSCWTPRCSWKSGSRCAPAGPTTRRACAASAMNDR